MPRTIFTQRRGDTLVLRVSVPAALRPILGQREIIRTLATQDRRVAEPRALRLAAGIKTLFVEARDMTSGPLADLQQRIAELRARLAELHQREAEQQRADVCARARAHGQTLVAAEELDALEFEHARWQAAHARQDDEHKAELARLEHRHEQQRSRELEAAGIAAAATARAMYAPAPQAAPPAESAHQAVQAPSVGAVIDAYLVTLDPSRAATKKHKTALNLLRAHVGHDRPVTELKQADIGSFVDKQVKLHANTFMTGRLPALRAFVAFGRRRFGDQGFPGATLAEALDGVTYVGTRTKPERKQRPLAADELVAYLGSPSLREIAAAPARACEYWLIALARFTGARVTELAQIDPNHDITHTLDGWWLSVTDERQPGAVPAKRLKNEASRRRIPIHSALTERFGEYVAALRRSGATALFPTLGRPARPGQQAGRTLADYIKAIGLRTEAAGRRIVGAHALRGTIERDLRQLGVGAEVRDALLGHVGQDGEYRQSAVARGYLGDDDRDTRLPDAMLREAIDRLPAPPVLPASLPPDLRLLPPRRGPRGRGNATSARGVHSKPCRTRPESAP